MSGATKSDYDRASAFFAAWSLGVTHPSAPSSVRGDAVQALAQILADERAGAAGDLEAEVATLAKRLRRAVGVVSDVARLRDECNAVLDDYAGLR